MLLSIVIQCSAITSGSIISATGRGIHGFWFKQLHAVNPEMAVKVHADGSIKSFSLSPLMDLPRPYKNSTIISAGQKTWFRICSLTEELSVFLLEKWVNQLPDQVEIAGIHWKIESVAFSPGQHPWAGTSSYSDLGRAPVTQKKPLSVWHFHFATPVTFHRSVGHFPFPLPDALTKSWLRRWQKFSPKKFEPEFSERVRRGIGINSYKLKTVPYSYGKRTLIGAVGDLSLRALDFSQQEKMTFHALAQYSFYCGSGSKTTQGMGMTRLK